MRPFPRTLALALVGVLALAAAPATAQTLAERVHAATADRDLVFGYPARADVCGYGDAVIRFRADAGRGFSVMHSRGDWSELRDLDAAELRRRCEFGPVRVLLERSGTSVTALVARVGGPPPAGALDLGTATSAEAADYLVALARAASRRVAGEALAALLLAEGDSWPALLGLARDREAPAEVRKTAIFWLGQAAADRATEGLRGILGDDSEELDIRRQAIFALSQQASPEAVAALIDVAESSLEPELRRNALFWLGQRHEDPRVVALFERILLGRR